MNKGSYRGAFGSRLTLAALLTCLTGCQVLAARDDVPPTSSYACRKEYVRGTPTAGTGNFGCHFRLLNPETGKVMAHTPYSLAVFASPASAREQPQRVVSLNGVTDAQGRSGFVRAAFPITPDRVEFVERKGDGPYTLMPRLINAIDGKPIPHMRYRATWCGGAPVDAMTDERGLGALFSSTDASCKVHVEFYRRIGQ